MSGTPGPLRPPTYWDYIRVDELLALQDGREADESKLANEEVLFITVHQIFELWFKLILRELRSARNLFTADPVAEQELSGAVQRLKRVTTILRVASHHWEVMETLPTRASFSSGWFRPTRTVTRQAAQRSSSPAYSRDEGGFNPLRRSAIVRRPSWAARWRFCDIPVSETRAWRARS